MQSYSKNALAIYNNLYMHPNESTVDDVHLRVANRIGNNESESVSFKVFMDEQIFRPNTPCMINACEPNTRSNNTHDNNLVACFVLDLEDSMPSIMEMWSTCAHIYAGGGGAGLPISNLRESGSSIKTGGHASGPLRYIEVVQAISDTVKSGGKSRRAANLTSFWYKHPDIMEYITVKKTKNLSAINISVLVDDEFMDHVDNNCIEDYTVDLISPNKNEKVGEVNGKDMWDLICQTAWESGDPGLLFHGETNLRNAFPSTGDILSTNPCGEVPLPPNSCCNLGHINLNKVLIQDENGEYVIDYDKYKKYIKIAMDFLDNVIDKTSWPHDGFKKRMFSERPVGLGIMGFSDILYKMKIPYGSQRCIDLFADICRFHTKTAFEHSIDVCYDGKKTSLTVPEEDYQHFIDRLRYYEVSDEHIDKFKSTGIRNSTVSTIAPTGSTSISADCSYAFEPTFALVWSKQLVDRDETLYFVDATFEEACIAEDIKLTREIKKKIGECKGSISTLTDIFPEWMREVFVTAHDVGWKKKIDVQAAGQRYISMAISSTCNLPANATVEDVSEAYRYAWANKLKGITVFRDGCLSWQPVNFGGTEDNWPTLEPMKRPMVRSGKTVEFKTPNGKMYLTGNTTTDERVFEVFMNMGQQGELPNILFNALGRVISRGLQYGVPLDAYIDTMKDCGGGNFFFKLDDNQNRSEPAESVIDAIAKVLDYHFNESKLTGVCLPENEETTLETCPSCKRKSLAKIGGCRGGTCVNPDCGYSSCS